MVVERFPSVGESSSETSLDHREKFKSSDQLALIVSQLRRAGKKVVMAHGVFDLLHMGHVRHLNEAKAHGDVLITTITADAYVNKGPGNQFFQSILERKCSLHSLSSTLLRSIARRMQKHY